MDFEKAMVLLNVALAVAIVIKQSKDQDRSRKGQPLRSAVSILNHYLNEGQELTESQRASLADIKKDMRKLYAPEDEESYSPAGG
jgi:RecG-like helicase